MTNISSLSNYSSYLSPLNGLDKGIRKTMRKAKARDIIKAALIKKTSDLTGVSRRQVRRVIEGSQVNEKVLSVYMRIQEGETLLMKAVKELVPFNN